MNNLKYSNGSATYVESLEKKIAELEKQIVAIDMNNEPVAWAVWEGRPHDLFFTKEESDELCRLKGGDAKTVPLYTHPAKTLTDEEIIEIAKDCGYANRYELNVQFARLILRKAQEK